MNNNSIQINSYLQGEMSVEEKAIFERQLSVDEGLQLELNAQRMIVQAACDAGLKAEFGKAMKQRLVMKKVVTGSLIVLLSAVTVLVYLSGEEIFTPMKDPGLEKSDTTAGHFAPFINPPMAGINIPLTGYNFNAEKGDTIFHSSGTILCFPPSSLVYGNGKIVTGPVKITYREFSDPLDFFLSGIPMDYDSAGRKYNFESSGMCEIKAYKDDIPVFVNPASQPEINLTSGNKSASHNLYYLDTGARKWQYKGKDVITAVKNTASPATTFNKSTASEKVSLPIKPVKPVKASANKQSFSIEIDPGSFEELLAYNGLKFEVIDVNRSLGTDANEHWDHVKLAPTGKPGIYTVIFTNARRSVSYQARPVLEEGDYDAAMKIFNEKNKAYSVALNKRLLQEKNDKDSVQLRNKLQREKNKIDNAFNDKINRLITRRNQKMRALFAKRVGETLKQGQVDQVTAEDRLLEMGIDPTGYSSDLRLSSEIIRSFSINNFGIWNCDLPQSLDNRVPIITSYTDSANNNIFFPLVAVVYKGFNGLVQFPSKAPIRVLPGQDNMLWAVKESTFYYFPYKDFADAKIDRGTKSFTFKMRRAGIKVSSYEEIRKLMDNF